MEPQVNPLSFSYVGPVFMLAMSAMTGLAIVTLSWFLGGGRSSDAGETVYECGLDPMDSDPHGKRFPVKFYVVAMLFILFDVEIALLYPFAVFFGRERTGEEVAALGFESGQALRFFGLAELLVFVGILAIGYVYLYLGGAFDWARDQIAGAGQGRARVHPTHDDQRAA